MQSGFESFQDDFTPYKKGSHKCGSLFKGGLCCYFSFAKAFLMRAKASVMFSSLVA